MTNEERMRIVELQRQGYGYKKIATITGLPQNTVKSYCSRHPVVGTDSTERDGLCRNCKKPLEQTPHKRQKKFCSDACRMAWWNAHPEKVERKAFENGELVNLRFLFGYNITAEGVQINEKEAAIVREMFSRFNGGESMSSISRDLNARGYTGALGGKWCAERMRNTLSNEKYLGNPLLQKRYRNNHIEKKLVANKGELPMYYAEGTHEPIIDPATFEQAQERLRKIAQQTANRKKPTRSVFTGLIRCGICGNTYKRVTYRGKHFWNCTTFQTKGKSECTAKKIPEDTLMALTFEVLGIDSLSTKVVKSKITEIRAEKNNVVVFCMEDGSEIVKRWKDRSRAESWTPEMKEQARQRALQARRKKE